MANTICWFDLAVANLERAKTFYSKVLDKQLEICTEGGFTMVVFPHSDNCSDVAGCLYEKTDFVPNTSDLLIYFDVNKRIHKAVAEVIPNGGKVVSPVEAIGPWGFRAVILDSEGNKIALHSMEKDAS
jgi:uncharacterized protein